MKRFEHKGEKLAPIRVFLRRIGAALLMAIALMSGALLIGVAGYHWIAGFGWIDSILEASMILGGMGPVNQLSSQSSKLFASAYVLFSGLIFIGVMGLVLAPLVHRMLHKFHLDEQDMKKK
jgi:hypothetical protein